MKYYTIISIILCAIIQKLQATQYFFAKMLDLLATLCYNIDKIRDRAKAQDK